MNIKKIISLLAVSLFLVLSANAALAADIKLTVGTGTASSGTPASINITADPVTGGTPSIAGAAFTLKHDSSLTITVDNTTFFDTFVNQGYTAGQDGLDANGLVDSLDSPFVTNNETGLTRIAAARKDSGTVVAGTILFTLTVTGTVDGNYPIEIIPTTITNTAAGWNGEASDLLIDGDDSYSPRLASTETANMVAGSVTVSGGTTTGPSVTYTQTYKTDLNLVPFTASNTGITTASEWAAQVATDNPGVTVSEIFGWNSATQSFTAPYANFGSFETGSFTLQEGVSYFIKTTGPASMSFSGNDYTSTQLNAGYNLVAVPYGRRSELVMASDLDADIVAKTGLTVTEIFAWNATGQSFGSPYANFGSFNTGDFEIDHDSGGVFVKVEGSGTYNPY